MSIDEPRYLNTDCILFSNEDLSPILDDLDGKIFVLWNEKQDGKSTIGFETVIDNKLGGPEADIVNFLELFDSPGLGALLEKCTDKVFDIGFESGCIQCGCISSVLSSNTIQRLAARGFSINIQIYPYRPEPLA
jgi:hypothetical protein